MELCRSNRMRRETVPACGGILRSNANLRSGIHDEQ